MTQFLRETWELWYWALFRPSLLQQRMNAWAPQAEKDGKRADTAYNDILLFRANTRFLSQFALLALLLSTPLITLVAVTGEARDWLFVLSVLLTAYGASVWFLPMGVHTPLLFAPVYVFQRVILRLSLDKASAILPPLPQLALGIGSYTLGLVLTSLFGYWLWQRQQLWAGRIVLVAGSMISVAGGSWLATQSWVLAAWLSGLSGFFLFLTIGDEPRNNDPEQAFGVAVGVAVGVAGVGAVVVAVVVAGISLLPLLPLLLVAWLVGFCFAPLRWRWTGLLVAGIFIALTVERQGVWALAVGVAALLGYYRFLPFYPLPALLCLSGNIRLPRIGQPPALPLLLRLPPFGDEILWLPLLGHSRILAAAFREDANTTLATLQQMRALPYPGYRRAERRALPQIVADQLAQAQHIESLIATSQANHPLLPPLVPAFYQFDQAGQRQDLAAAPGKTDEIATVLPRFLALAEDVGRACEMDNPALAERGLERCRDNLRTLQGQLPGFGLRAEHIERWKPAFAQWEVVLQHAIECQRTLSQGELLNPFQTGNPLRPERKELFKGRTQFVGDVLRYIYDASRPTLVLHGPRRCGKSSFLLNLPRLLPSDVLPVYYSLQAPAATASSGDFCYGMVRAMGRDLRGQGVVAPDAQRASFQRNPYGTLEDWLDAVKPRLGTRSVLLCFDEFEKLGEAIAQGRVSMAVFDQLRDLIQHSNFSFLFCGVQTLSELGPNWSSYFISVQPMEMTYLEPDAARELLTNPDLAFDLRYAEGMVDQVIAITRCQPYLLQLIGEQMVRQANRNQTRLLTQPLLDAALDAALTAGEPYFTNLWSEYTGTTPDEVRAGQSLLHAVAHGQVQPPTDTTAARAALRRLVRYHVIEQADSSHRCEVPFVARWVRERAVIEEV